jgi:RNA methyltransferase, TrmH family
MRLTSLHNPLLKSIRRAVARGRSTDEGLFVAEGPHLLSEALRGTWQVEAILGTEEALEKHHALVAGASSEQIEISPEALSAISATETSQELITLLRPRNWSWRDLLGGQSALLVVLDGIQDPGNAGTIVRSAEAFGATGVLFLKGSVHVSNTKFLRAAAGSIFRLPFVEGVETAGFLADAAGSKLDCFALSPVGAASVTEANFASPVAVVVGSEGGGLSAEIGAACKPLRIPTTSVESLNAAVSLSIALFEAYRQRKGL